MSNTYEIGETVIIQPSGYGDERIGTVARITPSGIIAVESRHFNSEIKFNTNGYERGSQGYGRWRIVKATKEKLERIERKNLASDFVNFFEVKLGFVN